MSQDIAERIVANTVDKIPQIDMSLAGLGFGVEWFMGLVVGWGMQLGAGFREIAIGTGIIIAAYDVIRALQGDMEFAIGGVVGLLAGITMMHMSDRPAAQ